MPYHRQSKEDQIARAEAVVRAGGLILYPTETLFALGADATNVLAAAGVVALKKRQPDKPLPLIIGGMEQLGLVTRWQEGALSELAASFWPGPLSVLVPAKEGLPDLVQDANGWTSVRWTPHPVARELCSRSGRPLIATSANLSGQKAVCRSQDLDPALTSNVDLVLDLAPAPAGGPPSTVVRMGEDRQELILLREGAIPVSRLRGAGYTVLSRSGEKK